MHNNMPRNRMGNRGQQSNLSRGLSDDRPFGGSGSSSLGLASSSGPLMTGHIQLHDLDLELALLKRKREIIEKQQNMLLNKPSVSSHLSYDQGYSQEFNPNRDFGNFYDSAESQFGRYGRQQGVKRPVEVWDNDPAHKRFNGPSRSRSRGRGRAQGQGPSQIFTRSDPAGRPPPLMSSSFPKPKPNTKGRSDFKPSKVTKPKHPPAPNKLNSYPVSERKHLVAQASKMTRQEPESLIFDADKPSPPKLMGRLELALGTILREMKQKFGSEEPHCQTFQSIACQRAIKKNIRERIRALMNGKIVGPSTEIVDTYRKEHPVETDLDLLNKVEETRVQRVNNLALELIEAGNPEKYFRLNFNRLLTITLKDMFDKLHKLYTKIGTDNNKNVQDCIDELLIELEKEKVEEGLSNPIKENNPEGTNPIEATEADKPEETGQNEAAETSTAKPIGNEVLKAKFYNRLIDTLLKRNLPQVLPKFKEHLINLINIDETFKTTKAFIIMKTNEKAEQIAADKVDKAGQAITEPKDEKQPPYYVKIVGRPTLPKRNQMKEFLDLFNPILIKKHRNLHHVLFVAFNNKENLNNILEKNGTVLGCFRLEITISERIKRNKNNQSFNSNAKLNDSDVQIIEEGNKSVIDLDAVMDQQITELLSSIRGEEESQRTGNPDLDIKNEDVEVKREANAENVETTKGYVELDELGEEENENKAAAKQDEQEETNKCDIKAIGTRNESSVDGNDANIDNGGDIQEDNGNENNKNGNGTEEGIEVVGKEKEEIKEVVGNEEEETKEASDVIGTPTKRSARITASTPRTVTTRRTSKLAQNN